MTNTVVSALAIAFLLLGLPAVSEAAFPAAQGYVTDAAHILDARSRSDIEAAVRDAEQQTAAEIAVATVSSLDGMSVEEYANKLFKEWGVGKKGADNGVLVLVAPSERKMRIEVGYGLEGVLPDGLAGEVIRTEFTPAFRNGDYPRGLVLGVTRIASIVKANHVLTTDEIRAIRERANPGPPALFTIPFFGVFVAIGSFAFGAGIRSKTIAPLIFSAIFAGVPLLMSRVPGFNAPTWVLGLLALVTMAWGYAKGRSSYWTETLRGASASGSTGWVMGNSNSGGGGSSGSSGGSFGGGSSGGGGASGSW